MRQGHHLGGRRPSPGHGALARANQAGEDGRRPGQPGHRALNSGSARAEEGGGQIPREGSTRAAAGNQKGD